jgi:phospholipid/cholesterol/gamma-HCH transport system permease protein
MVCNEKLIFKEIDDFIESLGIVASSLFFGGVVAIQTALNLLIRNPKIPYRFCHTTINHIGICPYVHLCNYGRKMGSFITSSIGTMRGNRTNRCTRGHGSQFADYLVFPKIIALLLYPFLIGIANVLGILGGWLVVYGGFTTSEFVNGAQMDYPFHITYAFIKTLIFAMLLASFLLFHGYYMKGRIRQASTVAFVWTSV